jgi:hypothetical protein
MKTLSLFKIGLILSVVGVVLVGYAFSEGEKISQTFELNIAQTASLDLKLKNSGIGYYKISVPDLKDSVFIQIIDSQDNILVDKKIETKMAVNYFEFENSGYHSVKVTNLSEHKIPVDVEFGDTNATVMRYPGILLFLGIILMMVSGFKRLKNYKIAQPDENSS